MSGDRLLDAAEVAELLSVPKTWVFESARSGALTRVRLGRVVFVVHGFEFARRLW